jgi:chromosome segregation ATPase
MLISEIILENFMSYEYARIPLKQGVNLVFGPNGAGKSSILLGISVALGQSYTERSKRLSDLIRWGKDVARVTLVLDNSRRGGRRPILRINRDQIFLTRVLRRDGKYWFELDNASATRADVLRLLSRFGVDPDNMLIIMHQDMAEQFIVLSPEEKLRLVEEAVGLEPYRRNVVDAQKKLNRIMSQEESLGKMLESAEQTLNYWREQYDRYQQKKQLVLKRRFLERELAWAEVSKREEAVSSLEKKIQDRKNALGKIENRIKLVEGEIDKLKVESDALKGTWQKLFEERLSLEKEKTRHEFNVSAGDEALKDLKDWFDFGERRMKEVQEAVSSLEKRLGVSSLSNVEAEFSGFRRISENLGAWSETLSLKIAGLEESVGASAKRVVDLDSQILHTKNRVHELDLEIERLSNDVLGRRINSAILGYQKKELAAEIDELNERVKVLRVDLEASIKKTEELGPRIVALRATDEVLDEIRLTDSRILALADVSEDIERMYESYSKLYFELKEKARVTAENREKALEEIKTRMDAWRTVISSLLDHVNLEYQRVLVQVAATGAVRLVNMHDIEAAGLEILVGFKGSQPVPLSIYSQSGGERSTATMSFLFALQQHIRSPFRAVDEYDVHMDPKNREVIINLLLSTVEVDEAQYLAITPNQMFFEGKDAHIITVQNIEGVSVVKEVG